jgi:hypothetical protein
MAIHPFTYPLHLPASTGSSQPRPPSCPSELGAVARSSLGSVGMAIAVQVVFDCADPPVIAVLGRCARLPAARTTRAHRRVAGLADRARCPTRTLG